MADVFTKAKRSEVMSHIRSRGNKDTELALARLLRRHRITGWRRHIVIRGRDVAAVYDRRHDGAHRAPLQRTAQRSVPTFRVKADFVFRQVRLAVFVDGCFWHGCPKHGTKPKNNRAFWRRKLSGNKARDILVTRALRKAGWRVLRVWEHELAEEGRSQKSVVRIQKARPSRLVRRIQRVLV